jgi:hypothetical protein
MERCVRKDGNLTWVISLGLSSKRKGLISSTKPCTPHTGSKSKCYVRCVLEHRKGRYPSPPGLSPRESPKSPTPGVTLSAEAAALCSLVLAQVEMDMLMNSCWYKPAGAVRCGGVATCALQALNIRKLTVGGQQWTQRGHFTTINCRSYGKLEDTSKVKTYMYAETHFCTCGCVNTRNSRVRVLGQKLCSLQSLTCNSTDHIHVLIEYKHTRDTRIFLIPAKSGPVHRMHDSFKQDGSTGVEVVKLRVKDCSRRTSFVEIR